MVGWRCTALASTLTLPPPSRQPRCFCYDDWTEKDCQTPSSSYPSSAVAGAVVGGLLFGALSTVGAAWFYAYYRSRKAAASAADAPVEGFYAPVNA